jgi:hypothetical protein
MIQIEYLTETLIKHYSDEGYMLLQNETGDKYAEPIDRIPCIYTYTETNELIVVEDDFQNISADDIEENDEK